MFESTSSSVSSLPRTRLNSFFTFSRDSRHLKRQIVQGLLSGYVILQVNEAYNIKAGLGNKQL